MRELDARAKDLLTRFLPARIRRRPQFQSMRLKVESARTGLPTFFGRTYSAPLFLMQGLVAVVLLLCCVNVSGLMLSKIHERQREFAVRTAIGAARWRLIRQYLTESFVIAAAGAALGGDGGVVGDPAAAPVFPRPELGLWHVGAAGQHGLHGDGSICDRDHPGFWGSARVARGPVGSRRALENADCRAGRGGPPDASSSPSRLHSRCSW